MVKLVNYCLFTVLFAATSADPHIRNPLFTRSLIKLITEMFT